jgi:hypothetical protein
MCTGLVWLRMGICGGSYECGKESFGFHKIFGISWLTAIIICSRVLLLEYVLLETLLVATHLRTSLSTHCILHIISWAVSGYSTNWELICYFQNSRLTTGITGARHWNIDSMELSPFEKSPVSQLLKNFPTIYGTPVITVFTRASVWSLIWATQIQSIPLFFFSLRSHLRLCLPSGLLSSGFPIQTLHAFVFASVRAICSADLILLGFIILNIVWRAVQVMKLLFMKFSPNSYYFIPLGLRYPPQHPVLKHSQYTHFPECQI